MQSNHLPWQIKMFRRSIKRQQKLRALLELVAAIRIDRNESTTNYADLQEQSHQSRDMILDMQGAFLRLLESAMGRAGSSGSGFLQSSSVGQPNRTRQTAGWYRKMIAQLNYKI